MNFKQIQKDCPKAFDKWVETSNQLTNGNILPDIVKEVEADVLNNRGIDAYHELEVFFDSVEIYILPYRDWFSERPFYCKIRYKPALTTEWNSKPYLNRTEAKGAAFIKSFKILEKQLDG